MVNSKITDTPIVAGPIIVPLRRECVAPPRLRPRRRDPAPPEAVGRYGGVV